MKYTTVMANSAQRITLHRDGTWGEKGAYVQISEELRSLPSRKQFPSSISSTLPAPFNFGRLSRKRGSSELDIVDLDKKWKLG